MPEKLNIWCIFSRHSEYSRNFRTREEAKKGRDISQDLNAAVIKMSQMGAREGGFHFFCRCILLAELRGVREWVSTGNKTEMG